MMVKHDDTWCIAKQGEEERATPLLIMDEVWRGGGEGTPLVGGDVSDRCDDMPEMAGGRTATHNMSLQEVLCTSC